MSGCIVFVANGFTRENVRLQPWRYLYEIARSIATKRKVIVVTDGAEGAEETLWSEGICVVRSCYLSVRCQGNLAQLISSYNPQQLWWSVTPRTIAYRKLLKTIDCEKYALITCPLYSYRQLIRASLSGVPFHELRALWQQRLIPRLLFTRMLCGETFRKIFTQSDANAEILAKAGITQDKLVVLRVGIDSADREPVDPEVLVQERDKIGHDENSVTLLYFGAIRRIRGFDALVSAFSRVVRQAAHVKLVVLARGADELLLATVDKQIAQANLTEKVCVVGGWLTREQVWAHIKLCDVVVLPFVIVPSDVPIAILESMARGRPVIGSPIDGIPELISNRGLVVDPLNPGQFASAILSLANDQERRKELGHNAEVFMRSYPDWEEIGNQAIGEACLV